MRTWRFTHYVGDVRGHSYSLADLEDAEGSTVSSVVAESVGDVECTISNSALASSVWSGKVTTPNAGRAVVRLTCAMSDGETHVRRFEINVRGTGASEVSGQMNPFDIATG